MKVGILAAGRGERLQADGLRVPKPLVPIRGVPLIGRLLHALRHGAVGEELEAEPFLLLTTDTVFSPTVLPAFLQHASQISHADGVLALTPFVEDEKPLWVELDIHGRIRRLGDQAREGSLVTAGIYFFTPTVYREADSARRLGFAALRQFLAHLVERGCRLYGYTVPKVIDVDRLVDIATAEAFLAEEGIV